MAFAVADKRRLHCAKKTCCQQSSIWALGTPSIITLVLARHILCSAYRHERAGHKYVQFGEGDLAASVRSACYEFRDQQWKVALCAELERRRSSSASSSSSSSVDELCRVWYRVRGEKRLEAEEPLAPAIAALACVILADKATPLAQVIELALAIRSLCSPGVLINASAKDIYVFLHTCVAATAAEAKSRFPNVRTIMST